MYFVLDRIEDGWAVLESETGLVFQIPMAITPKGIKEGSVVRLSVSVDDVKTAEREEEASRLLEGFFDE